MRVSNKGLSRPRVPHPATLSGLTARVPTAAPILTRPPERAETRSSPKRAHSDRARSASKEAGRPSRPHFHPDKIFSVIFSFSQLVAGWKGVTSGARVERGPSQAARSASTEVPPLSRPSHAPALPNHLSSSYLFYTPRLAGRRSPRLRASNEGSPRPRVARARRALLIASHSPHTPFHSNTAPPHRRKQGPDRAACRRHPLNR